MAVREGFGLVLIIVGVLALLWGGGNLWQASPLAGDLVVDMLFTAAIGGALIGSGVRMSTSETPKA
jgi:hypothetical protein